MMQSVQLNFFKNHQRTVVDICSPFNILVGRNGSGKSAVLDAIEWCLFHSKSRELRASSHSDLVNSSKPEREPMFVQVSLLHNNSVVQIRREYDGRQAQMFIRRCSRHLELTSSREQHFSKLNSQGLHDILTELHIPFTSLNRILIKQNATSIARASPRDLLAYIESVIGTNSIQENMNKLSHCIEQTLIEQKRVGSKYSTTVKTKNKCRLNLVKLVSLHNEMNTIYLRWTCLLAKMKCHHQQKQETLANDMIAAEKENICLKEEFSIKQLQHDTLAASLKKMKRRAAVLQQMKRQSEINFLNQSKTKSKQQLLQDEKDEKLESVKKSVAHMKQKLNRLNSDIEAAANSNTSSDVLQLEHAKNLERKEKDFDKYLDRTLLCNTTHHPTPMSVKAHTERAKDDLSSYLQQQLDLQESKKKIKSYKRKKEINSSFQDTSRPNKTFPSAVLNFESALQDKVASDSALSKAKDMYETSSKDLAEAQTNLQQCAVQVKNLNQHDDHHVGKKEGLKSDDIIFSQYNHCKSLCAKLRASTTSSSVQSLQSHKVACGLLIDHFQLNKEEYKTALKVVLGVGLACTVVVGSREEAVKLSLLASHQPFNSKPININVYIVDEMPSAPLHQSGLITSSVMRLADSVYSARHGYERVLHEKLRNWVLFLPTDYDELSLSMEGDGNNSESVANSLLFQLRQKRLNLVTLKGDIFYTDGEIQSTSTSMRGHDVLNFLMKHKNADVLSSSTTEGRDPSHQPRHSASVSSSSCNVDSQQEQKVQCLLFSKKLQQLEIALRKQEELHHNAEVHLETCKQRSEYIYNKWSSLSSKGPRCTDMHNECDQPQEEMNVQKVSHASKVDLLKEFTHQYTIQEKNTRQLYHTLLTDYFSSSDITDRALHLCQQVCDAAAEMAEFSSSSRRQDMELRRQRNESNTTKIKMLSLKHHRVQLLSDMENAAKMKAVTGERLAMLREDIVGLSDELMSRDTKLTEAKALLQESSQSLICIARRQRQMQQKLKKLSLASESNQCQAKETESLWTTKSHQALLSQRHASQHNDALHEDLFSTPDLPSKPVERVCNTTSQTNMSNHSQQQSQTDHTQMDNHFEHIGVSHFDLKRLKSKEIQFSISERLLQQQLEEIKTGCPQDSWLTYFQDLVQKCSQHSNEYNILSEKENSVRKELAALSEEKFTTLLRALDSINEHLDPLFSEIVPLGSCFLDYPRDKVSLLEIHSSVDSVKESKAEIGEGIRLRTRHEGSFREVQSLSGGQVAAVGLALVFSLLHCYPSPFVIMDEVDAALDTATSLRVGRLIRRRCQESGLLNKIQSEKNDDEHERAIDNTKRVQFTVVSHRPEMQIWADQLVGFYSCQDFPTTVSVRFSDSVEDEIEF